MFAPQVVAAEQKVDEIVEEGGELGALQSRMPTVFEARPVTTPEGTFGYIRIRTFSADVNEFRIEFTRLITIRIRTVGSNEGRGFISDKVLVRLYPHLFHYISGGPACFA